MTASLTLRGALIAVTLILPPHAGAQQTPASGDVTSQRAERVKSLLNEIVIQRDGDFERITEEYAESHISEIRSIIQEHVLEALNRSDKPDGVRRALKDVRGALEPSYVYFADLKGVTTVVAAFELRWGGALPDRRGILLGYRKTGLAYELAAEASVEYDLTLEKLNSPRENEMWLLAWGGIKYIFGHIEQVVLYSFDGYQFKALWVGGGQNAEVKIMRDEVTVDYMVSRNPYNLTEGARMFRDTVRLTSGGPEVSKQELPQK